MRKGNIHSETKIKECKTVKIRVNKMVLLIVIPVGKLKYSDSYYYKNFK